jgi:hypothetical protein
MTQQYINELVRAYPSIQEVWLFGSRANGTERPDSDWDYMVFGDDDRVSNDLCQNRRRFKRPGIDMLFVGTDPDIAASPWPEDDGYWKTLGLGNRAGGINWQRVSATKAQYIENKDANPDKPHDMAVVQRIAISKLVYRR